MTQNFLLRLTSQMVVFSFLLLQSLTPVALAQEDPVQQESEQQNEQVEAPEQKEDKGEDKTKEDEEEKSDDINEDDTSDEGETESSKKIEDENKNSDNKDEQDEKASQPASSNQPVNSSPPPSSPLPSSPPPSNSSPGTPKLPTTDDSNQKNSLSGSEVNSQINTNQQNSSPTPLPTLTPSPSPVASPELGVKALAAVASPTPTPTPTPTPSASSSAATKPENSQTAMLTGDATAVGNAVNLANNSNQGSQLAVGSHELVGSGEANLNAAWDESHAPSNPSTASPSSSPALAASESTTDPDSTSSAVLTDQISPDDQSALENSESSSSADIKQASASSKLEVIANTGSNTQSSSGEALLATGDATAVANLLNILNAKFVNSQVMIKFLNIWHSFSGDIVLPRPETVLGSIKTQPANNQQLGTVPPANSQQPRQQSDDSYQITSAHIINDVDLSAESGGNLQQGQDNLMLTGDSWSSALVFSLANSSLENVGWYWLWLNVAGDWSGKLFGWDQPDSVISFGSGSHGLGVDSTQSTGSKTNNSDSSLDPRLAASQNELSGNDDLQPALDSSGNHLASSAAIVDNQVKVVANSGSNSQQGQDNLMLTGRASSWANIWNMVNTSITNSRIFVGFLNILGDWSGNVYLAYPQLAVEMSADQSQAQVGDEVIYTVSYFNRGRDGADNVRLNVQVPDGLQLASVPAQATVNGNSWSINLDYLPRGGQGKLQFSAVVTDWDQLQAQAESSPSWWNQLVPAAMAAEGRKQERPVVTTAQIQTSEPQTSTRDNQSQVTTVIYRLLDEEQFLPSDTTQRSSHDTDFVGAVAPHDWPLEVAVQNNVNDYVYPGDIVTFEATIFNQGDEALYNLLLIHEVLTADGQVVSRQEFSLGQLAAGKKGRLNFGLQIPPINLVEPQQFSTRTYARGELAIGASYSSNTAHTSFAVHARAVPVSGIPVTPLLSTAGPLEEPSEPVVGEVLGAQSDQSSASKTGVFHWWMLLALILTWIGLRWYRWQTKIDEQ